MQQKNKKQIRKYKLLTFISLVIILFSTDIANTITDNLLYKSTAVDAIRYQIALIIPCLIISINSSIYLFMYAKTDKNSLDT